MVHQERRGAGAVTQLNVIFFGTPGFSVSGLQGLLEMPDVSVRGVVTQPDKPSGRGGEVRPSPVKELAVARGLPVLQPASLRKELDAFTAAVGALGPIDIGVVIAFGQILPREVLELPRAGCVNVHASLLPRWRGAAPIQRAIAAGDAETGVCLMQMDVGLDTGAVYSRETLPISPRETAETLHDKLAALGTAMLKRDLPAIAAGQLRAQPQASDGITYAHKIGPAEGLIQWGSPAEQVARTIRALSPYPGCHTFWRGARLKILDAVALAGAPLGATAEPGTITSSSNSELIVACGTGAISVARLQLAGKRQMPAGDFLRGTGITPGDRFSSAP